MTRSRECGRGTLRVRRFPSASWGAEPAHTQPRSALVLHVSPALVRTYVVGVCQLPHRVPRRVDDMAPYRYFRRSQRLLCLLCRCTCRRGARLNAHGEPFTVAVDEEAPARVLTRLQADRLDPARLCLDELQRLLA